MTSWVSNRHFVLDCLDFSIAQLSVDRAQRVMGSAALVLGSTLVATLVCFASMASIRIASFRFVFV